MLLGVKLPTLYAYVSRGLVRSVSADEGRTRQYLRREVEELRRRRVPRPGQRPAAAGALRFGEPVLDSSITSMDESGPSYRGRSAVKLAEDDVAFEAIAELLWTGELPEAPPEWGRHRLGPPAKSLAALLPEGATVLDALALLLAALAARDHGRFGRSLDAVLPRARTLCLRFAAALALPFEPARAATALAAGSVARAVVVAVGARPERDVVRIVNRALVLCADHELNVSTFAARVAASAGADLYASLSAALAALSGPIHGGMLERIEAVAAEVGKPERAARVVHERYRRGESVPGFFHPLYPNGDPRAPLLLDAARRLSGKSPRAQSILALVDTMRESGHGAPTIDVALAALAAALGLPSGSAVGLFAVGRSAGWAAHVLEQYAAGFLIRPRARYVPPR